MSDTPEVQESTPLDASEQTALRREKLQRLREQGEAYPNDFRRDALAQTLQEQHGDKEEVALEAMATPFSLAGRMMTRRVMGKACFIHIQDMSGRMQIYVRKNELPEGMYEQFKQWDIGDIIGCQGLLFKTKTGELTLRAQQIRLLSKALHPLPDKFHGLNDREACYRQRYLDTICNAKTRVVFQQRTQIVDSLRRQLVARDFLEVETPMMHVIPGGAAARPFTTHHNALDMPLYLRIAPELYLKRLLVGGFERVFEINRNFRNEGLSTRHNPEFTMLEYYQAFADFEIAMDTTEALLKQVAQDIFGRYDFESNGVHYDFAKPFARMTVLEAIISYNPDCKASDFSDIDAATKIAQGLGIVVKDSWGLGKIQIEIFEKTVENKLIAPTFITAYPTEVSPLARCNADDPTITDRFELFIGGREIANGFSELNDPEDQAARFQQQVKDLDAGDLEAMHFDADYILALEHAMPPSAGVGIGVDRLVMLLTDSPSIRDVILFPHLRSNKKQ